MSKAEKKKRCGKDNESLSSSGFPPPPAPDPRIGKRLFLSKEERLELQNIDLRRQILDSQSNMLARETDALVEAVSKRIDDDLGDYAIDRQTGECTFNLQQAAMNAQRKSMRPKALEPKAE